MKINVEGVMPRLQSQVIDIVQGIDTIKFKYVENDIQGVANCYYDNLQLLFFDINK